MNAPNLNVGDKLRTHRSGRAWWTVQAAGSRYVICTRQAPFKPKGEYLYTILDFVGGVRGPTSFIGNGWDVSAYKTPEAGWRGLHVGLLSGDIEVSRRASVPLDLTEVRPALVKRY